LINTTWPTAILRIAGVALCTPLSATNEKSPSICWGFFKRINILNFLKKIINESEKR
jgi:hypothetical protein